MQSQCYQNNLERPCCTIKNIYYQWVQSNQFNEPGGSEGW